MLTRCAIDTGGTFTDLALEYAGQVRIFKCPTTPADPIEGILDVLELAAGNLAMTRRELLASTDLLIHGTTRATNAVLTQETARTALLTTLGHRDVLLLREGGRMHAFDWSKEYQDPYIPRALTFEIPERVDSQGRLLRDLDEAEAVKVIERLAALEVEAVAVCLLWSIVNPSHEQRLGELLEQHLPGVPYTLSHLLNPTLREYRRASSVAIDASLKPLMGAYLSNLEDSLRNAGFDGELLVISTSGGLLHAREAAATPISSINSGPAMAPVAGREFAAADGGAENAIVADTGGTSYDLSVVRSGRIPMTRETWLGEPLTGHITGFPAVDVKSIGAGGGSIAWIDRGGLLHVGPQSAGADPGPAAYGRGGTTATITDACLVLGYLHAEQFLGGAMRLDLDLARAAVEREVAQPLGLDLHEAASAMLALTTEQMVQAITEITIDVGLDPREAVLIGGGGAAGLNSAAIMRRLGCKALVIPQTGAALSAVGALMADLTAEYGAACFTSTEDFDGRAVDRAIESLEERCHTFAREVNYTDYEIELVAEARLARQVWQLDVPLRERRFADRPQAAESLLWDFRELHEQIFAVRDERSAVEVVGLRARVTCPLPSRTDVRPPETTDDERSLRAAYFPGHGLVTVPVHRLTGLELDRQLVGPAIVESAFTTVVLEPGMLAWRRASGSLVVGVADQLPSEKGDDSDVHATGR